MKSEITTKPMRTSYHTNIKIACKFDMLPKDAHIKIPSSTLYNWKRYDFSKLFGYEDTQLFEEKLTIAKDVIAHKHLYTATKALWHINSLLKKTINSIRQKKQVFRSMKENIVQYLAKS